jgi:hypothetical protein
LCAIKHNNANNLDTPSTVNNVFFVEASIAQIPEEEEDEEDDHEQCYNTS